MEWNAAVEEILARRRERLGGPVSLEEVLTLHDALEGEVELSEQERDRLLDRITSDPRAAHQLRSLLRFPGELASAEEEDENGAAEEAEGSTPEERWLAFRSHLRANPIDTSNRDRATQPLPAAVEPKARDGSSWYRFLPLAASFLLGAFAMFLPSLVSDRNSSTGSPDQETLRINLPIIELTEQGDDPSTGGNRGGAAHQLPPSEDGWVLTLATKELRGTGPFDLVLEKGERSLVRVSGLEAGPGGVFVVTLANPGFAAGTYRLLLQDDGETKSIFPLEIVASP